MNSHAEPRHAAAVVRARLDRMPASRFAVKLLVLLAPVWVLESYDIGTVGTTLAVVKQQWHPGGFEVGALAVASTLAIALGLVPSGRLVDRVGRRKVLVGGVIWFTVFTAAAGLSPNVWVLIAMRFLAGLGLGAVFPLPYVYLAEFLPPGLRARFVGYLNGLLTASYVIPPLTAIVLLNEFAGGVAWRLLHAFALVGLGYAVLLARYLPESPRWLALQGRVAEAESILDRIENSVRAAGRALPEPDVAAAVRSMESTPTTSRRSPADIFRPPLLKRTVVVWLAFFGTMPVFYVLLTFAPALMVSAGYQLTNSLAFVAMLQLAGGVGGLIQGALSDRRGRRPLIVGYGLATMAGLAILAVGHSLPVLLAGGLLVGFFGLGIFPVAKLYVAEQYPVELRGVGTASTEAFGRFFGGVVFTYLVPFISSAGGTTRVIWITAVLVGLTMVLPVALFGRETRGLDVDVADGPRGARPTSPQAAGKSTLDA